MSLAAVLAARDARALAQRELIERTGQAVLSLSVVAPGTVKDSAQIKRVFAEAAAEISVLLIGSGCSVAARVEQHHETGPELMAAVAAQPESLKRAVISLEEQHPWGRLWDIDVVTDTGPLSRVELGVDPRRCLVCQRDAAGCARSRRHPLPEVVAAADRILDQGSPTLTGLPSSVTLSASVLGPLAAEALRIEARLTPKPGLIDVHDCGSHEDMTLGDLLASADALEPWLVRMAEHGARPGWTVAGLRCLGRSAEQAMAAATGGVNTHRGAIHVLGWLCALAAGAPSADELARGGPGFEPAPPRPKLRSLGGRLAAHTAPLLREWLSEAPDASPHTHGCSALISHGLPGARGEVASGLPTVIGHALPGLVSALNRGWAIDDALLATLVILMAWVDDTNLVSRGGIAALREVQGWARSLVEADLTATDLRCALAEANTRFVEHRWSPGGSADLLAATWFLAQVGGPGKSARESEFDRFGRDAAPDRGRGRAWEHSYLDQEE